jgi:acetyl-CoA acetyltransferase
VYELGHTGVPVMNVNNACASGSSALMIARNAVAAGMADLALAVGFEKMGRFTPYTDRAYPLDRHMAAMASRHESSDALITAQMFGNAGREHMARYGTKPESFARIAVKNHKHSVHNPRAQFRKEYTLEEVMASPALYPPLTLLQSCPTSNGAGAAVVASERFVREHGLAPFVQVRLVREIHVVAGRHGALDGAIRFFEAAGSRASLELVSEEIRELAAATVPEARIRRTLDPMGNARTTERTIEARAPSILVTTPWNHRRSIHNRQGSLKKSLICE